MSAHWTTTDSSGKKQPSFGVGSFLFALVFALLVYLLVLSMAHHHFFTGGHPNRSSASSATDN
jgi:hypothetical protein